MWQYSIVAMYVTLTLTKPLTLMPPVATTDA
jgi:hypothetical protein